MGIADWSKLRSEAQVFIHSGVKMGLSGASILSSLKDAGMGYREQDFYEDWRMYKGYVLNEARIATLRPETPVPDSWVTEDGLRHAQRYRYDFKTTFVDRDTGDIVENFRSFSSDQWLTKGQATDYLEHDVPWSDSDPKLVFQSGDMIGVVHRQGDQFP
jgi:hypothetical protein